MSPRKTPKSKAVPAAAKAKPAQLTPADVEPANVEPRVPAEKAPFVVGIGASAGGLEAMQEFLGSLPPDTGMCFMVISHQHPGHTSLLPELLGKCTAMPVALAQDGTRLEPNRIFVSPPGGYVGLMNRTVHLLQPQPQEMPPLTIDYFFRSLALDQRECAVCIVLSGTGSDGSLGLRAVKGEGGLALVQAPESARYAGMPSSASVTGLADFVLAPAAMPARLIACNQNRPRSGRVSEDHELPAQLEQPMHKMFVLLRARTGHDFSGYKLSTLRRRIERRMTLHQVTDPQQYVHFLQQHPHELDILFRELLISVTSFFRDPDAFKVLSETALPALMKTRPDNYIFRVWITGCSTGEEAYSIAITLRECMLKLERSFNFQIFATDLDMPLIETARAGRYPEGVAADVPTELLHRYFTHDDSTFQVRREIREMVVFAPQNIIRDPPFTKIDLLCCRNLLIYLNADFQKRLMPIFHYALKPGGLMLLGPSETIGTFSDLFEPLDQKWKLFRRKDANSMVELPDFPVESLRHHALAGQVSVPGIPVAMNQLNPQLERLLLQRFAPPSVVINNRGDILFIHGRTGAYLEPGAGRPRMNVYDMAREGLSLPLTSAVREALAQGKDVHREKVRIKSNGGFIVVDLDILVLKDKEALRGLLMVSFREAPPAVERAGQKPGKKQVETPSKAGRVEELEREVEYARQSLQRGVEELQSANEELKSSNEELQSSNEELQSTIEELETSKEEMQSLNEELTTVNAELQSKVDELSRAKDDMQNLLNSIGIATLFLDNDLKIKRYTDQSTSLFKLIPSDVGRPLADLTSRLLYDNLSADATTVLRTLEPRQHEVQTNSGSSMLMRIMPYRTAQNAIEGLVITFVDVTEAQKQEHASSSAREFFESIFNTMRSPALVLDDALNVMAANRSFYQTFRTSPRQTEKEKFFDLGAGDWDVPEMHTLLEKTLPGKIEVEDVEVTATFRKLGKRVFLMNARRMARPIGMPAMVLLSMEDVTQAR